MQPMQSVQPIQPIQPIQTIQTMQPMQPMQPIQPVQPIQPIQSIQPIQPVQPVQSLPFIQPIPSNVHSTGIYFPPMPNTVSPSLGSSRSLNIPPVVVSPISQPPLVSSYPPIPKRYSSVCRTNKQSKVF